MRKRMLLIVAPLCVVALAAGVAVAAPSSRAKASDAKLDNPHPVRPIAASPSVLGLNALGVVIDQVVAYVQSVQLQEVVTFLDGVAAGEAVQFTVTRHVAPPSGGNGDFLSCVKQRESSGDYTVHNYQGSGASGAYQMMPGTWNSIAGSVGRDDLVGLDPAAASPQDQDAMASALYAQRGAGPWGGGC